jgi:hypothetical protein
MMIASGCWKPHADRNDRTPPKRIPRCQRASVKKLHIRRAARPIPVIICLLHDERWPFRRDSYRGQPCTAFVDRDNWSKTHPHVRE